MKRKMATTIKIYDDTKHGLDTFREYKDESYNDVIKKLVFIVKSRKNEPELSDETLKAVETARKRMAKGRFVTHEEAKRRLGL